MKDEFSGLTVNPLSRATRLEVNPCKDEKRSPLTMARILVVDDSKFSRNRAMEALRKAGHEVFEAQDGELGLEAIAVHAPDCVLLDMLMPVLAGPEFLDRLRSAGSQLPVVVMTADIQTSTRALCESAGVSAFLQKPIRGDEVCRAIDDALVGGRGGVRCH
jgi:CheY-like chemotaxis protein